MTRMHRYVVSGLRRLPETLGTQRSVCLLEERGTAIEGPRTLRRPLRRDVVRDRWRQAETAACSARLHCREFRRREDPRNERLRIDLSRRMQEHGAGTRDPLFDGKRVLPIRDEVVDDEPRQ